MSRHQHCFPEKLRFRNERKNSKLMTRDSSDLSVAPEFPSGQDQSIRSTTEIRVVTRHHYGISAFVPLTSFLGETSEGVAKCRLFSQANC